MGKRSSKPTDNWTQQILEDIERYQVSASFSIELLRSQVSSIGKKVDLLLKAGTQSPELQAAIAAIDAETKALTDAVAKNQPQTPKV